MSRPELGTLTKGQEVIVHDSPTRGRRGSTGRKAIVTKVARVWVTLAAEWQYTDWTGATRTQAREWRMRLDTQDEGIKGARYQSSFVTLEQHAYDERQAEAIKFLNSQGIAIQGWVGMEQKPGPWRGREVELADLIRKHIESEDS